MQTSTHLPIPFQEAYLPIQVCLHTLAAIISCATTLGQALFRGHKDLDILSPASWAHTVLCAFLPSSRSCVPHWHIKAALRCGRAENTADESDVSSRSGLHGLVKASHYNSFITGLLLTDTTAPERMEQAEGSPSASGMKSVQPAIFTDLQ